ESERERQLERIIIAVSIGEAAGLRVNAGHGLNYKNVEPIALIEGIQELNIGHAIIAEAVFEGLGPAVRRMRELINNPGEK
ncbi:MAG: pyridoxine 5'-phosphate synthase, partial [Proteobacteria bacterium]|nr:pyridoxine 5'-phosphate synthase [Pseudomonadota bacterium]